VAFIKFSKNEHGIEKAHFFCDACGIDYSVCPAPKVIEFNDWNNCMGADCDSYDASRDVDAAFDSDEEFKERAVVSFESIKLRKHFKENKQ